MLVIATRPAALSTPPADATTPVRAPAPAVIRSGELFATTAAIFAQGGQPMPGGDADREQAEAKGSAGPIQGTARWSLIMRSPR